MEHKWWRFWSADSWREWWRRRPAWTAYRSEARQLDSAISDGEARLSSTNSELAKTEQQLAWAGEVRSQDLPIKTARNETGLGAIPGVALLETRKREGKEVWTPIDHGTVYLTDKKAIFSGSKNVEFRYNKLLDQEITANGLYLSVSSRKKPHKLSGPAEKISALITASEAVGRGEEPTAPFEAKAESLRYSVADTERDLDRLREERAALVAPPRPISPAWIPAGALVLIFAIGGSGSGLPTPDAAEAAKGTTQTTSATTAETTTSGVTTSTLGTTTTEPSTTSTIDIENSEILFAPASLGASGDPNAPTQPGAETATVISITDGDTLNVKLADGADDTVRLIGINSPESGECFADEASSVLAALAPTGSQIAMTVDVSDRDQFDRLLRYLWVGTMSVNEEMVRRGAAISRRYPPDTSLAARFEAAQSEAQSKSLGLWAPDACGPAADADLRIVDLVYDAPGDDNQNLNGEWITIRNSGDNLVDLTGWVVKDESASHRYNFPTGFSLSPGESVTVYTGCGDNFGTNLYWCAVGSAIWNNDGDTAFLLDANGNTHTSLSYSPPTTTAAPTTTQATTTQTTSGGGGNCHPSYPDVCIPPPPPDLDCGEISYRRFTVVGSDPHGFDGDNDGIGCESG